VTLEVVAESSAIGTAAFPYVPGLFAFRELPTLVTALRKLSIVPDLLVCDGHGVAHPRRFGLACHVGVLTGLPSVGVGKTRLVGTYEEPLLGRGEFAPLRVDGEVLGRVLRTQDGIKPVFVSVGHRIDLDTACRHVLATSRHRLPETTRRADRLSRDLLGRIGAR
jgi:deoxyribonuclease V